MKKLRSLTVLGLAGGIALAAAVGTGVTWAAGAAVEQSQGPVTRRLTPEQYQNVIADVFGPEIQLGGRFEPDMRVSGLLAVGSSGISITPAGMEQYDAMAQSIAEQVTSPKYRGVISCKPKNEKAADDACAKQFLGEVGKILYRRPLTKDELSRQVVAANKASTTLNDFYAGLSLSLAAMLESPQFLFVHETLERDPQAKDSMRLDAYSKASSLSFFLWNSTPDALLLQAAERGELRTEKGIRKQVERMIASPRLEEGVRAFFADMLQFDRFETLAKDGLIYPDFSNQAAMDAKEQTLRTLVDLLVVNRGDYRDVFTTRKTFLTQALAAVYAVPVTNDGPNGAPDMWKEFTFPDGDPRGGGIQTHMSFVALHSHPGRSSATLRGVALREILMCQHVPPPPGVVDFNIVQETNNPIYRTARDRLMAHQANPVCAGCHKIIDPMGLALENFDGDGSYRTTENQVKIDTSGSLDGRSFEDAAGLGQVLHDHPATKSCLLNRLTSYALGRTTTRGEADWTGALAKGFEADGYRLPDLMARIATSPEFYRRTLPIMETKAAASEAAKVQTASGQVETRQ